MRLVTSFVTVNENVDTIIIRLKLVTQELCSLTMLVQECLEPVGYIPVFETTLCLDIVGKPLHQICSLRMNVTAGLIKTMAF
eukprot:273804-Amphidinium_carterae.1